MQICRSVRGTVQRLALEHAKGAKWNSEKNAPIRASGHKEPHSPNIGFMPAYIFTEGR